MTRTKALLLLGVALAWPSAARADDLEVPPYTAVPPCIDRTGGAPVGTVVAVTGPVSIASPYCEPAPAVCGSVLYAGQVLTTGPGAQVALLADGRYVQLGADSRVAADASADGATRIAVEQGTARIIDVGSAPGAPLTVATPALETRDPGSDVVASVDAAGASSICSWADPIEVRDGDRVAPVAAGGCAGPATTAGPSVATALPISIAAVGRCDVAVGDPTPTDVASGPPGTPLPPTPPPLPPPTYCQGGACLPTPPPPPPPPAVCCTGIGEQPVGNEPPPD
jgi:hypothetical protein